MRETNDGGATNDEEIRRFTRAAGAKLENFQCDGNDCSTKKSTDSTYYENKKDNFKLTVINPAGSGSINGLRIIRQIIPMRESNIQVLKIFYSFILNLLLFLIINFLGSKRWKYHKYFNEKRWKVNRSEKIFFPFIVYR